MLDGAVVPTLLGVEATTLPRNPAAKDLGTGSGPLVLNPERLKARLKELPAEPGCYMMRDGDDRILYIGKAKVLRQRVRSYFHNSPGHSPRISLMVRQVCDLEFIVTDSEDEALALESNLIKHHQPHFNVLLKDDKKYPYVCITWSENYPRIFITRQRRFRKPHDRFYGPYVDVGQLRRTLAMVKRVFPLRQRPQPLYRDRTCLNFDIGRCPGVCQEKISSDDYQQILRKVAMVFQGRNDELLTLLTGQMERYAERLDFEAAARVRDQLQGLESLSAEQKMSLGDSSISRDVLALAADRRVAAVQLFQMRAGKLVGRLGFTADAVKASSALAEGEPGLPMPAVPADAISVAEAPGEPTDELPADSASLGLILQRVIEEHYSQVDPVEIPPELLLQYPLPQQQLIEDWLSERRGRKVRLAVPQRQQKADWIELVERNAGYELQRTQRTAEQHQLATEDLAQLLDLASPPRRIEGFDISHIQGSDAVASQVVFIDGLPAKQHYRKYRIQSSSIRSGHSDDFMAMAEIMRRRFRRWAQAKAEGADLAELARQASSTLHTGGLNDWPDVVMIDGGKGQLSAVMEALRELNLHEDLVVCSLAKQREEVFLPGAKQPLDSEPGQLGIVLLRRLRDEAHRFAISFHRQQRGERMKRSRLSDIPGLGPKRVKELLAHFRSIDAIQLASAEAIAKAPGVGPALARQIWEYFHPSDLDGDGQPAIANPGEPVPAGIPLGADSLATGSPGEGDA
ncbi:MAG: excinuclease ABC subunit UvrC [Synechococcales cyanobacterium SupBloom_Metag_052]|nr:excinuclease ABC subunit UvrC [Synechococcales cyanobacterium SupBloom_Metag_052]